MPSWWNENCWIVLSIFFGFCLGVLFGVFLVIEVIENVR